MEENNESFQIYQKYLFSQIVKKDSVIREYLKNNENISQETIQKLYDFYNSIKNKKLMLEIGKGVIRGVLINTKNVICESENKENENQSMVVKLLNIIKPIFKFIEPENITINLTDDEYLALINDLTSKKKSGKKTNLYILIGSNMLMSLISSNLKSILDNSIQNEEESEISNEQLSKIYNKLITENDEVVIKVEDAIDSDSDNDDIIIIPNINNKRKHNENNEIESINDNFQKSPDKRLRLNDSSNIIIEETVQSNNVDNENITYNKISILDTIPEEVCNEEEEDERNSINYDINDLFNEIQDDENDIRDEINSLSGSFNDGDIDDNINKIKESPKQEISDIVLNSKNTKIKQMLEEFKQIANNRKKSDITNSNTKILPFE